MGHRYYDPRTGRFLTQDPAGDGTNWYAYCGNNPVNKTDPSGLSMGLPGTLGAPDQRYNGAFGGGLGDGPSDDFFQGQDEAMKRGQAQYASAQGWNLALGALKDFLAGTGSDNRTYTDGSTQVKELLNSKDGAQLLKQMAALGYKLNASGGISTLDAAKNTAGDFFLNGTETQLGAFDWKIISRSGNNVGVMVWNNLSANSFLYHNGASSYYRAPIDTPYGPITVQEPLSNITQYFIFHVTVPH